MCPFDVCLSWEGGKSKGAGRLLTWHIPRRCAIRERVQRTTGNPKADGSTRAREPVLTASSPPCRGALASWRRCASTTCITTPRRSWSSARVPWTLASCRNTSTSSTGDGSLGVHPPVPPARGMAGEPQHRKPCALLASRVEVKDQAKVWEQG